MALSNGRLMNDLPRARSICPSIRPSVYRLQLGLRCGACVCVRVRALTDKGPQNRQLPLNMFEYAHVWHRCNRLET